MSASLTQRFGFVVFNGIPPGLRSFCGWKFENNESLGTPIAFEGFDRSTANNVAASILFDRRRHLLAVNIEFLRVEDINLNHDICGHTFLPLVRLITAEKLPS